MQAPKKERIRITEESVSNIKVATTAVIEKVTGGFKVVVSNDYGSEYLKDGAGEALYRSKASAKQVVHRHNEQVKIVDKGVLPSKSMRAPI